MKMGFDNAKYLKEQTQAILKRVSSFDKKLYLECGGKLLFDYHAARVLPGFDPNVKMKVFQEFKDDLEVIICIYAGDIERKKIRSDFGLAYDNDVLKMIDDFRSYDLMVNSVVITRYDDQPSARQFKTKLERRGVNVYTHRATKGYPTDVDRIVSDEGYGANPYIPTTKPIVVVTAPGPGSGKLATCLSQMYHDYRRGTASGYSKFETFPIWNIPVKHPVNMAYEAATADLRDVNMIDYFHYEAYSEMAVNYNRDLEAFPVLKRIIERITGEPSFFKSPTDMGVNRCGFGIVDNDAVCEASRREILRRYYRSAVEYRLGMGDKAAVSKIELLLDELNITQDDRPVIAAAKSRIAELANEEDGTPITGAAMELADGTVITARSSKQLHGLSALLLHATKHLAGIPKDELLIPNDILSSFLHLKRDILHESRYDLDLDETLAALALSATISPHAKLALETLPQLKGCDTHLTHIPSPGDESGLRKVGLSVTSEAEFSSKLMFNN